MSIAKLDVENYASWSTAMKYVLIERGLWGAVDPDFLEERTDKAFVSFGKHNGKPDATGQVCWHCGKPGHLKRDCKQLHRKRPSLINLALFAL